MATLPLELSLQIGQMLPGGLSDEYRNLAAHDIAEATVSPHERAFQQL